MSAGSESQVADCFWDRESGTARQRAASPGSHPVSDIVDRRADGAGGEGAPEDADSSTVLARWTKSLSTKWAMADLPKSPPTRLWWVLR